MNWLVLLNIAAACFVAALYYWFQLHPRFFQNVKLEYEPASLRETWIYDKINGEAGKVKKIRQDGPNQWVYTYASSSGDSMVVKCFDTQIRRTSRVGGKIEWVEISPKIAYDDAFTHKGSELISQIQARQDLEVEKLRQERDYARATTNQIINDQETHLALMVEKIQKMQQPKLFTNPQDNKQQGGHK